MIATKRRRPAMNLATEARGLGIPYGIPSSGAVPSGPMANEDARVILDAGLADDVLATARTQRVDRGPRYAGVGPLMLAPWAFSRHLDADLDVPLLLTHRWDCRLPAGTSGGMRLRETAAGLFVYIDCPRSMRSIRYLARKWGQVCLSVGHVPLTWRTETGPGGGVLTIVESAIVTEVSLGERGAFPGTRLILT